MPEPLTPAELLRLAAEVTESDDFGGCVRPSHPIDALAVADLVVEVVAITLSLPHPRSRA